MTVKVNNQEIPSCMEIQGVYSKVQITGYIQEQEGQTTFSQKKKKQLMISSISHHLSNMVEAMGQACVTVTGTGLLVFIDDVTTDISSRSFSGQKNVTKLVN